MTNPDEDVRERLVTLGEIASEVAHELRNVLQVIAASAYLARQDPPGSLPHIAKIEKNARTAHGIVDDLMSLARGEPAKAEPVLLVDVLLAARADLGPVVFHDELEPAGIRVRAHAGLLARLFHVLYENAIAVSAPRPPIIWTRAARSTERENELKIEVQDDGPGVDPAIAPRIFDPLVTGRAGGTGLGLALARRIVGAHGGRIALLPRVEPAPVPSTTEDSGEKAPNGAHFQITLTAGR